MPSDNKVVPATVVSSQKDITLPNGDDKRFIIDVGSRDLILGHGLKSSGYAATYSGEQFKRESKSEEDDGHPPISHPTSYVETLIHLLKGSIGSGLFAMGDAYKNGGIIVSPVLTVIIGIICVHAQKLLVTGSIHMQSYVESSHKPTFAETVELSFKNGPISLRKYSKSARICVNIFLCITQMGFCAVYFVFVAENMQQVMKVYGFDINMHIHMAVVFIPILLSCWIRNLKYLVPVSLIANILMTIGIIITVYFMSLDLPPVRERDYFSEWSRLPLFLGTTIYSFEGISLVLPLYQQMKKPDNFTSVAGVHNIGLGIVTGCLVLVGFLGYLKYGEAVEGTLTLNLDKNNVLAQSVKIIISISILFTYALQMYVPVRIIWPKIVNKWGPFNKPIILETIFRTCLVLVTFVLAECIPHLNLLVSLIGAVASCALALIFPALIDILYRMKAQEYGKYHWIMIKNFSILFFGFISFVTGTYASVKELIVVINREL